MYSAARHGEIEMRGVARVDYDRVQLRPVRSAVLHGAHPFPVLRIVIDRGERLPCDAAVLGAEQPLRRGPWVPDARLVGVTRREPESVIDRASFLSTRGLIKRGRPRGFPPGAPEFGGANHGGTEVAGLRRRKQRSGVAR